MKLQYLLLSDGVATIPVTIGQRVRLVALLATLTTADPVAEFVRITYQSQSRTQTGVAIVNSGVADFNLIAGIGATHAPPLLAAISTVTGVATYASGIFISASLPDLWWDVDVVIAVQASSATVESGNIAYELQD